MFASRQIVALGLAVIVTAAPACRRASNAGPPPVRSLSLQSEDGVALTADFYPVSAPAPPGLVLVHGLGEDKGVWRGFAVHAQRQGYACLAVDLRGHGGSVRKRGESISYRRIKGRGWLAALADIDAAKQALAAQGASPDDLAVAGAGLGANLALHYALAHPEVQALVLVSPGRRYQDIPSEDAMRAYGRRPSLLITAQGDSYASASCRTLKAAAGGLCELREYGGSAHGVDLLAASDNAVAQVFVWLAPIIGPDRKTARER